MKECLFSSLGPHSYGVSLACHIIASLTFYMTLKRFNCASLSAASFSLSALKLKWNKNNTNVDQHDKINSQKIFILEMTFEKWKKIMNLHKFHVMKWVNIWKRRWSALDDLFIHNSLESVERDWWDGLLDIFWSCVKWVN